MARNRGGFIFLDSIRHSIDEPDPKFRERLSVVFAKRREVDEDHYQPYIDYVPGRDI